MGGMYILELVIVKMGKFKFVGKLFCLVEAANDCVVV